MDPRVLLLTMAALAFGSGAYVFGGLLDPWRETSEFLWLR
jgi:hypothetical protein